MHRCLVKSLNARSIILGILVYVISFLNIASEKRPNFVFLISEDNSQHYLKLYNKNGAVMPNVEALAKQGLIFEHAFSNAPVCSTARTTLATGAFGPKIGTFFHRAYKQAQLPEGLTPYSQTLKDSGYYTTNNAKTDYNFIGTKQRWDMSSSKASWRNRKSGQPFFHVQTFQKTHEHTLHFPITDMTEKPTKHNPKDMVLPPIFPDTPLFRYTQARYLDNHQVVDGLIGDVIQKLKDDGLMEDTFIFYFGDHGGVLPGSKGYAYERGLHIPLVVRVPKNYEHLLSKDMRNPSNTKVEGFVSFVDFAPTLLNLAGLPKSVHHDGTEFLGEGVTLAKLNERETTFGYADRFDEKSDMVRTLRVGDFKYMRNYQPYYHDSLFNNYRYKQQAFKEWKTLYQQNKLNPIQSSFFQKKSPEALYDLSVDPYETHNLASNPKHQRKLTQLRLTLQKKVKSLPDLGFYPEPAIINSVLAEPVTYGQRNKKDIEALIDIADLQLVSYESARVKLKIALSSSNKWHQYWALISLSHFGKEAKTFIPSVYKLLSISHNNLVKGRAIEFLTLVDNFNPVEALTKIIKNANSNIERLALLNIAAYLHEVAGNVFPRPKVDTWAKPNKDSITYNSDKYMNAWLSQRWDYVSKSN